LNQLIEIDTSTQFNGYPEGVPNPGAATSFFAKYGFVSGANNGQIQTMQDSRTASTVTYSYDLLKRVTGTTVTGGSMLGQTFGYDGFGNLTSKSVPAGSSEFPLPGVNSAKNWLNGSTYDQNGNVTTLNNATLSYDVENRLSEYTTGSFVENYAYDEANRRVDRWSGTTYDNVYFYGPNGKLLAVVQLNFNPTAPYVTATTFSNRIYFGKMLLGTTNGQVNTDSSLIKDRLGSVQPSYAYGTATGSGEQTSPGDDFATYWKDSSTGFEYAMNRYYSTGYGRFLTVDPFGGSASLGAPGSFNRYSYADPVNQYDPSGLCADFIGGIRENPGYQPLTTFADSIGADVAYPYAGLGYLGGLGAVISHADDSTYTALASLTYALNTNSGLIDVIAYSGGAQAFTSAYSMLTTAQQNRIGLVLYISPGANGPIAIPTKATTTIEEGTGGQDDAAMSFTQFPSNITPVDVNCAHEDLACLLRNAPSVLAAIANNGPCNYPRTFYRKRGGGAGTPSRHGIRVRAATEAAAIHMAASWEAWARCLRLIFRCISSASRRSVRPRFRAFGLTRHEVDFSAD